MFSVPTLESLTKSATQSTLDFSIVVSQFAFVSSDGIMRCKSSRVVLVWSGRHLNRNETVNIDTTVGELSIVFQDEGCSSVYFHLKERNCRRLNNESVTPGVDSSVTLNI